MRLVKPFPVSRSLSGLAYLGLTNRRGVVAFPKTNTRLVLPRRLSEIEDRRVWNPTKPDFKLLSGFPVRYSIPKKKDAYTPKKQQSRLFVPAAIGFSNPSNTIVCVRRKMRREIMHAKGIAGGHVRPPKFSEASQIECT